MRKSHRHRQSTSRRIGWATWAVLAIVTLVISGSIIASVIVESIGVTPRALAPYILKRVSQHNPFIVGTGELVAHTLIKLDRGLDNNTLQIPLRVGWQPNQAGDADSAVDVGASSVIQSGNIVFVTSSEEAIKAIATANAGDEIVFAPGSYRFRGSYIPVSRPGAATRPIVVRAHRAGTVTLEFGMAEGFLVSAPYWHFENLLIRGVCKQQNDCEHAFHVIGGAHHFIARNNKIVDFNAHFKINGARRKMPDDGLITGNTITNTSIRKTDKSVTPIDLVAASGWVIEHNFISDFVKGGSDRISYGAFAKGGGSANRFQQNVIICEDRLKGAAGQRVGLSLGGGGTGAAYCRDQRCITEQDGGIIEANLIASCSDDGIYINRSAGSKIYHNTVIDTGGVVVRFPESSADVEGNLVDGSIRNRDQGILRSVDNRDTSLTQLYLGWHPARNLYRSATSFDFNWIEAAPTRSGVTHIPLDLCQLEARPSVPRYGAFEEFSGCISRPLPRVIGHHD